MKALLLAVLATLGVAATAAAQSPLVAELRQLSLSYHENPARLDALHDGLERIAAADSRVEHLVALAQISYIWGDVRARTQEDKLRAYDHGRQAARRAMEAEPRNVPAHFWFATNTGRWGQTNGILRSLFLLGDVQREIQTILELDPGFTPVYALAGNVYYEVPGLLGGDLGRAEQMFRTGLGQDPKYTLMRVGLAKTLIKRGHLDEARRELDAVLEEKTPSNPADWTMKDVPEARRWLQTLGRRS